MRVQDAIVGRRFVLLGAGAAVTSLLLPAARAVAMPGTVPAHGPQSAARWIRTSYEVVAAQGITPPTAARVYAAVSIACYESLLGGMPQHATLQGQLAGLDRLPRPVAPGRVEWPLVLGAAAATVLAGLFTSITDGGRSAITRAS